MSEVTQYKRIDIEGSALSDAGEIAYYKQQQKNDIIDNYMLGDFNIEGNYVIKKEIIKELISITKVAQHTYGKTTFCLSGKKLEEFGYLEFGLKIERVKDKGFATLELLESINKVGGYYQNINTVTLATYQDKYDIDFLDKVYSAFNILKKEEYQGRKRLKKDIEDDDTTEIEARKNYLLNLKNVLTPTLLETEKKLYEERIKLLMNSGEKGKAILIRFKLSNKKISKLFLNPKSADYYKHMNQLLDKSIEDIAETLDKDLLNKLKKPQMDYIKQFNDKYEVATKAVLIKSVMPRNILETNIHQQQKVAKSKEVNNYYKLSTDKGLTDSKTKVVKAKAELMESIPNDKSLKNNTTPKYNKGNKLDFTISNEKKNKRPNKPMMMDIEIESTTKKVEKKFTSEIENKNKNLSTKFKDIEETVRKNKLRSNSLMHSDLKSKQQPQKIDKIKKAKNLLTLDETLDETK